MFDQAPDTDGSPDAKQLNELIQQDLREYASRLAGRFSPSKAYQTDDLINQTLCNLLTRKSSPVDWQSPEARTFVRRVMHNAMIDYSRKRPKRRAEAGADVEAPSPADEELRLDLFDALVAMDRSEDPYVQECCQAFKAYYFVHHCNRLSQEGPTMVLDAEEGVRTYAAVGQLLGLTLGTAHARVKWAERWLQRWLKDYRSPEAS